MQGVQPFDGGVSDSQERDGAAKDETLRVSYSGNKGTKDGDRLSELRQK